MKVLGELEKLQDQGIDLSRGVVIQGSAPLALLGIIEESRIGDIDLVVNEYNYTHLKEERGWIETVSPVTGDTRLQERSRRPKFDVWLNWYNGKERRSYRQMEASAHRLGELSICDDEIRIGCVKDIRRYKEIRSEKKDPSHLEGIEEFLAEHPAFPLECAWERQLYNIYQARRAMSGAKRLAMDPVHRLGSIASLPNKIRTGSAA